jgi:oxygen-independent coproporphyrinogen-3 oxidase
MHSKSLRIGETAIPEEDLAFEFLMNVLRLKDGVAENLFAERTGLVLADLEPVLSEMRSKGLMKEKGLCTTDKGLLFLNSILESFADR